MLDTDLFDVCCDCSAIRSWLRVKPLCNLIYTESWDSFGVVVGIYEDKVFLYVEATDKPKAFMIFGGSPYKEFISLFNFRTYINDDDIITQLDNFDNLLSNSLLSLSHHINTLIVSDTSDISDGIPVFAASPDAIVHSTLSDYGRIRFSSGITKQQFTQLLSSEDEDLVKIAICLFDSQPYQTSII